MNCNLINGDCLTELKKIPDESIDLVLTDPPYGLEFMGKEWDKWKDSFNEKWCSAVFPKLKAGAFLVFTMTPRQDLLWRCLAGVEKAGFELRSSGMYWLYHTGFPKASDMSKMIDKQKRTYLFFNEIRTFLKEQLKKSGKTIKEINEEFGFATTGSGMAGHWFANISQQTLPTKKQFEKLRKVINFKESPFDEIYRTLEDDKRPIIGTSKNWGKSTDSLGIGGQEWNVTESYLPEAKKWNGWKSNGLKPSVECIVVAQKPKTEKTIVGQVLATGTGAINVDATRIPYGTETDNRIGTDYTLPNTSESEYFDSIKAKGKLFNEGRFPANLLVSDDALVGGEREVSGSAKLSKPHTGGHHEGFLQIPQTGNLSPNDSGTANRFYNLDKWAEKHNITLTEESAFFDVPKPSRAEKEKGIEHFEEKKCRGDYKDSSQFGLLEKIQNSPRPKAKNFHPTTKPIKLFSYLAKMFCQPEGTILDPFLGSGTTGISALKMNFNFIGIEKEPEYFKIAEARIKPYLQQTKLGVD